MSKKLTYKFFLFSLILVILASVLFINVFANNTLTYADEDDGSLDYQEIDVEYNQNFRVWGKTTLIDFTNARIPWNDFIIVVDDEVETLTLTDSGLHRELTGVKLTIESRNTDLTIYIDGMHFVGKNNETLIYNQSSNGTVHFVNIGNCPVKFVGTDRTDLGYFKDGIGISGIFYTKGNISFAGEYGFIIDGGITHESTSWENLHYGNTGLQVAAGKKVYVDTTVNVIGGQGLKGAAVPYLIGHKGGHGGTAFDGPLASIIIGEDGFLSLKGGKGGKGASQIAHVGPVGEGGEGGAAYYMGINVNDNTKFTYEDGEKGENGAHHA